MEEVVVFSNVIGKELIVSDLLEEREKISSVNVTGEKGILASIALKVQEDNGIIVQLFEQDKHFEIFKVDNSSVDPAVKFLVQDHE